MNPPLRLRVFALICAVAGGPLASAAPTPPSDVARRVESLIAQMTPEEKMQQLVAYEDSSLPRLGIPNLECGEALHGILTDGATSFPQAIALGCTWDPALVEKVATVAAQEARAVGIGQAFSPMLGLARDPRWGRVEESYGEDAFLVTEIGVAFINGLQGKGSERFGPNRIIATPKHFAADGEPFAGLNGEDPELSDRELREEYFMPFEAAVKRAHAASIMPAHHAINGVPCHMNSWLLNDLLRKEWGFDGYVVSDSGDIAKLAAGHRLAKDMTQAGTFALTAGVDRELGGTIYKTDLLRALKANQLPMAVVDRAVRRFLTVKLQLLGLGKIGGPAGAPLAKPTLDFSGKEDPFAIAIREGRFTAPTGGRRPDFQTVLNDPTHDALALLAAQKAIVLLKNQDNLLPLDKTKVKKILVAGPLANQVNLGGYSPGNPKSYIKIVAGLKTLLGASAQVDYAEGCKLGDASEDLIGPALAQARTADVVIAVVGHSRDQLAENLDRDDLGLIGGQLKMVQALQGAGKPVIVIFQNGAPISEPWIAERIPAIIESWYLGQATGTALAQMLFGDVNPGGKMSVSVARNAAQLPCYYNHPVFHGLQRVYNSTVKNLYVFGYGLSYTTFAYSDLKVQPSPFGPALVSATIKNTGSRAGDEVAQLYIRQDFTSIKRPVKELRGFQRVTLNPGESKTVTWPIGGEQLRFWKDNHWVAEAGEIHLMVGSSSEDIRLNGSLNYPGPK